MVYLRNLFLEKMKKIIMLLMLNSIGILSQAQFLSFKASTGDVEMDGVLTNVDVQARQDIGLFKSDVSINFGVPVPKIERSLKILSPGDLFMAAQLSVSLNKPFDNVVETYSKNKGKGWGVIAKDMGIKPGSPEFHAMKKSMKSKGAKVGKGGKGGSGNGKSASKGSDDPKPAKANGNGGKEKGGKGNGKKK
jgi:hypothetical protein